MSDPASPHRDAARLQSRLGPIARVHRVRSGLRRTQFWAAVTLAAAAGAAWLFAAARGLIAYTAYGPLLVPRWVGAPLALGLALALGAAWMAARAWRASRVRVRLHASGLAILRGRRGQALTWGDVRRVWSRAERTGLPGLPGTRRVRLEIEAVDGRRLRLDDRLEDFESLAAAVKAGVYPRLLAEYTRAFNGREPIQFGPLRLTPDGVVDPRRGELIGWKEIRGASLAGGRVLIETARPGRRAALRVTAHRVPNVELCTQLIQEIGQSA